jgi:hypothetical protein
MGHVGRAAVALGALASPHALAYPRRQIQGGHEGRFDIGTHPGKFLDGPPTNTANS